MCFVEMEIPSSSELHLVSSFLASLGESSLCVCVCVCVCGVCVVCVCTCVHVWCVQNMGPIWQYWDMAGLCDVGLNG